MNEIADSVGTQLIPDNNNSFYKYLLFNGSLCSRHDANCAINFNFNLNIILFGDKSDVQYRTFQTFQIFFDPILSLSTFNFVLLCKSSCFCQCDVFGLIFFHFRAKKILYFQFGAIH